MNNDTITNSTTGHTPPAGQNQWLDATMVLRKELKYDLRVESHQTNIVIEDTARSKFFQIGVGEYQFIKQIDGTRTAREIVAQWNDCDENAAQPITETTAMEICRWLFQNNLASAPGLDRTKRAKQVREMARRQKAMGLLNPISFKVSLFNPNSQLKKICPYMSWMFTKAFLAIWIVAALYALQTVWSDWARLSDASIGILADGRWIWLLVSWAALKVIHEMAHGVACRRYGGEVNDSGILFILFTPMAFVNVTSSWRFSNRWHRIVVAAAGMYIELFVSFIAIAMWAHTPHGLFADVCFNIFLMSSVTTLLFNANPLMRFDGYYMMTDAIGVTNLYSKGTKLFADRLRHWFFGIPANENICLPHETRIVAVYGVLAFVWKILISFSLIIGASVLFYGAGKILAVVGIGLWFGLPIWRQLQSIFGPNAHHKVNLSRVIQNGMIASIVLALFLFLVKAPATKGAAAIVQFKDESLIRAEVDGFIEEVFVHDGQAIRKDDLLMRLRNPQLIVEMAEIRQNADAAEIQTRIHRQSGEIALAQTAYESHLGFRKQLAEKQLELESLSIKAKRDGFVFERNLNSKIGSFAKRGDLLLTTAQQKTKEIVVAIDQQDWDSMKGRIGAHMKVVMPMVSVFDSKLTRISARANDIPTHPSLCSNYGGPLATRIASDEHDEPKQRLLTPHFTVDLDLPAHISENLKSGQRGRAFFATNDQSLGSYLFVATQNWLEKKLELATQSAAF